MKNKKPNFNILLRQSGLRVTVGRWAILDLLWAEHRPMSVERLRDALNGKLDKVTIYRAMESFAKAGIVTRVDLHHPHTHYELAVGRKHHHHLICNDCGKVEDIDCDIKNMMPQKTKNFPKVTGHSLEFFGFCRDCL